MSSYKLQEQAQTGIAEMDREHALELQIVRAIHAALADSDKPRVDALLQQLEDFTNAHFLAEQLLMRLHAYPGYEAHQQEHDQLMQELEDLSQGIRDESSPDPVRATEDLERWLLTHIQSEDQALAEYLKQQGHEG
jgi:hemerythrin